MTRASASDDTPEGRFERVKQQQGGYRARLRTIRSHNATGRSPIMVAGLVTKKWAEKERARKPPIKNSRLTAVLGCRGALIDPACGKCPRRRRGLRNCVGRTRFAQAAAVASSSQPEGQGGISPTFGVSKKEKTRRSLQKQNSHLYLYRVDTTSAGRGREKRRKTQTRAPPAAAIHPSASVQSARKPQRTRNPGAHSHLFNMGRSDRAPPRLLTRRKTVSGVSSFCSSSVK